jgi:hypothetical protein
MPNEKTNQAASTSKGNTRPNTIHSYLSILLPDLYSVIGPTTNHSNDTLCGEVTCGVS